MIDIQFLRPSQRSHVKCEGADVLHQVVAGFFEGNAHSGFAEVPRAADQELHPEQRFAAAGRATDQGWAAAGKPAQSDLVEPGYAGWALGKGRSAGTGGNLFSRAHFT